MRAARASFLAAAFTCLAPGLAAAEGAWVAAHGVDAVTYAASDGAVYAIGPDKLIVVCTRKGERRDFSINVVTMRKLGRGGEREVICRIGDSPAVKAKWSYTSRAASPSLNLFSRMMAREMLRSPGDRIVIRFYGRDDRGYDLTAPLDSKSKVALRTVMDLYGVGV